MREIRISYDEDWQGQHRKTVRSAYGSSPYFLHYWDEVSEIWNSSPDLLVDLNEHVHMMISSAIGIESTLRYTDDYVRSTPGLDLRECFKSGRSDNPRYIQVFEEAIGFEKDLSILDLLFCLGPETTSYLLNIN